MTRVLGDVGRGKAKRLDALRAVAVFSACGDDELESIDRLTTELRVPQGKVLTHEGAGGLDFIVVVEGTATVDRDGEEVATVGPGSFIGEMALLDRAPRSATVTAETDMSLLVLNIGEFFSMLDSSPGVRAKVEAAARERREANR